jgi:predicted amidophosphoribosyltransferase
VLARHQQATESATRAVRALLDVLLPPRCAICGGEVDCQGLLCADCFRQTGFISEPFCARCGVPFGSAALGGVERLCPTCRAELPVFGRARAALRYDAQGRRLVLPLKHADRTELTAVLVPQMARAGAELLREADVIVPGEKSASERAAEVAQAFDVRPSRERTIEQRKVLLIDDVMTSGATANACAGALLAAGATSVDVLVAARVPDPRLN